MKKFITLIVLFFTTVIFSQSGINYKAIIKDGSGNILASQSVDVQFIIYQGVALTNNVYEETHTTATDANGLVILNIGAGTTSDVFGDIDWASDQHFLNVQVDIGSGLTDLGTSEFKSVPYALSTLNGVKRINDLIDGKSDYDGTNDGSSIFLGTNAGVNDDGTNNRSIGIGWEALTSNVTGRDNMAIGNNVLTNNNSGIANVGIGTETLFFNTGSSNIGIGYHALFSNTSGNDNVAIGFEALNSNITGVNNNAFGTHALRDNTEGFFNNAFGRHALQSNTTGPGNTAIGHGSLRDNTTGSNNTALGNGAGDNVNGDDNVFIGRNAGVGLENSINSGNVIIGNYAGSGADYNNRLYIDNSNTSNPLLYGEFDNNFLRINGTLDVNNAYQFPTTDGTLNQVLQTDGAGVLTWQDVNTASGLEAINEGNGIGWRLIGNIPENYGNVGFNAVDLSYSNAVSSNLGATGNYALATGLSTIASSDGSVAMGIENIALGYASTTFGAANAATGNYSLAMGEANDASAYGSVSMGTFNIGAGDPINWVATDPLFIIGNGVDDVNRSNALSVLKNGTITAPSLTNTLINTAGDKVLITKEYLDVNASYGLEKLNEGNGEGWGLKGRFSPYYGSIGLNAIDLSISYNYSDSKGATGYNSFAAGASTTASGSSSTALGSGTASGSNSMALGLATVASGDRSVAIGYSTDASGSYATAIGNNTEASGSSSTSIGTVTLASGNHSTAMGRFTKAESYASVAIGHYNIGGGNPTSWVSTDPLFEIGNGDSSIDFNAFTVLKNGNIGVGTANPTAKLQVNGILQLGTTRSLQASGSTIITNSTILPDQDSFYNLGSSGLRWSRLYATNGVVNTSDRRDKTNINDLKYGLNDVMKLKPVSYNWKTNPNQGKKLGLIAQDLMQVIPEVVMTRENVAISENDTTNPKQVETERLGVYYSDLIPVLIKSIQELKLENDRLKERLEMLENQK